MRILPLPKPIVLVPARSLSANLRNTAGQSPGMPRDPGEIAARLNELTWGRGVPVTVPRPKPGKDWACFVYTPDYKVLLHLTEKRDAYQMSTVKPLGQRDHQALAEGCLIVRPKVWHAVHERREIPIGSQSYAREIASWWQHLQQGLALERGSAPLSERQTAFLDSLDGMIDATETISRRQADASEGCAYRSKRSTGEQRHGRHSVYRFDLAGDHPFAEGTFVHIAADPDLRGQITRLKANTATVKFARPIDWDALPGVGELRETPNDTVYRSQRQAVDLLRDGQSANPHLLSAVVDHRARPIPPRTFKPDEPLDAEQQIAFEKALNVEDLLLVHGPPGTGKTRTISQIARSAVHDLHQKVLISSHSNRAVDNVLSSLPADIEVLRVGYRDAVTPEGLPYLLEDRERELRERVRAAAELALDPYRDLDAAEQWHRQLGDRTDRLDQAAARLETAEQALADRRAAAAAPHRPGLDRCVRDRATVTKQLGRYLRRQQRFARWRSDAASDTTPTLIRWMLLFLIAVLAPLETAGNRGRTELEPELRRLTMLQDQLQRTLDQAVAEDPLVHEAQRSRAACERDGQGAQTEALAAVETMRTVLRGLTALDPAPEPAGLVEAARWARGQHERITRELSLLRNRKDLLHRWHAAVTAANDQLNVELIRYADVIAATCIGSASRPELSGVDFDLAVVDEAGQIGMTDVIVPLTRARRGVLVGDHQQLPPFLDSDVDAWGKEVGDPHVRALLSKSALEILTGTLPVSHQESLIRQRRMPAAIAAFVSEQFYERRLITEHPGNHRDPLMATPLTFIDTSGLPPGRRRERENRRTERWSKPGRTNEAEAELLTRLAAYYDDQPGTWCLIVPYRAQLNLIKRKLRRRIADTETIDREVGTVDAFQGGERDVVLYGFTRSNRAGNVGFLRELRRVNVAFTRPRSQLVVVGDLSTLMNATDPGFRDLMADLRSHLARRGDIRTFDEINALLDEAEQEGGARGTL